MRITAHASLAFLLVGSIRALAVQVEDVDTEPCSIESDRKKVPGVNSAYYCDDPSDDIFQIRDLDFMPRQPRIGYYLNLRFIGRFTAPTGDIPWLNITGSINGRPELAPMYYSPLCDLDVFQEIVVQSPAGDYDKQPRMHRSCPPSIQKGYAVINAPPMPLSPDTAPEGRWDVRAEAMTHDGRRIFCIEGSFNVTKGWRRYS